MSASPRPPDLFVPLVENGFSSQGDPIARLTCERYLAPVREAGVDTLILGCTHYPLLSWAIAEALPGTTLISAGAEAANMLTLEQKQGSGSVKYYVSDDPTGFEATASVFLAHNLEHPVEKIDIETY